MTEPNGRRRIGWIVTTATLAVGLFGAGISWATYRSGVRAGETAAVAQAAVDQKRLADVEARAQAASDRMGERIVVDAVQNTRIEALEEQHRQVIERLDKLVDVLWDWRRSDQGRARKPGE